MTKREFEELLDRYRQEACTPEERRYVEDWIEAILSKESHSAVNQNKKIQLREYILRAIEAGLESEYSGVSSSSPPPPPPHTHTHISANH